MRSYNRSLKNLLIRPEVQLRYASSLFAGGLIVLMVYIASFLLLLNRSLENIATTYNVEPAVAQTLQHSISTATYSVIFFSGFLLITVFALGLILSHRVFGPMVPIMRVLEALKNGDYSARANLRSKDEFNDVMEAVNDLAAQLESKYGNSSSANSHAQS